MRQFCQPLVAPVGEIYSHWQRHKKCQVEGLCQMAEGFDGQDILFYSVHLGSEFYQEINKNVLGCSRQPKHVVAADHFFNYPQRDEDLRSGVKFALLISSDKESRRFLDRVQDLKMYGENLEYIVVARKDWAVRNFYRSFPYDLREKLYLDFPTQISPTQRFLYSFEEVKDVKELLTKDFAGLHPKSLCPDIEFRSRNINQRMVKLSRPRKLFKNQPRLSVVCSSPRLVKQMAHSKQLKPHFKDIELIVLRGAGQRTHVLPRVPSLATTFYWLHLTDPALMAPSWVIKNLAVGQSSGETIIFVDEFCEQFPDSLVKKILSEKEKIDDRVCPKGVQVFSTSLLKKSGGFDPIFQKDSNRDLDLFYRLRTISQNNELPVQKKYSDLKSFETGGGIDKHFMQFKHGNLESSFKSVKNSRNIKNYSLSETRQRFLANSISYIFFFLSRRLTKIYKFLTVSGSSLDPISIQKSHQSPLPFLGYVYISCRRKWSKVSWRFQPETYSIYWRLRRYWFSSIWRLKPSSYRFYWTLHRLTFGHLWRLKPSSYLVFWRVRHIYLTCIHPYMPGLSRGAWNRIHSQLWRLKPSTYKFYWRCRGLFLGNLWRLRPDQLGWLCYKCLYPLRKIYYFISYQLNKPRFNR